MAADKQNEAKVSSADVTKENVLEGGLGLESILNVQRVGSQMMCFFFSEEFSPILAIASLKLMLASLGYVS